MDRIEVATNDDFGRHIVLTGDVKAGEVVVDEFPFDLTACKECSWPLCEKCQEETAIYHKSECNVFKSARARFSGIINEESGVCTQLDCITPLR
uniref:Uncharacterized protein n=1 Tax=Megaselia scalaris TaxID=36166 RepID=T1GBJ7_MEGSC